MLGAGQLGPRMTRMNADVITHPSRTRLRACDEALYRRSMPPQPRFTLSDARNYLPYFLLLLIFVAGVWLILAAGSKLQPAAVVAPPEITIQPTSVFWENFRTPLSILLTQIIVILTMAGLFRRL